MKSLIRLSLIAALCSGCATHRAPGTSSGRRGAITEASVRGHLEFLAGDALNGRGSGTRDEWIAASYIGAQLRRWGVEPLGDDGGYVQEVRVERRDATSPPGAKPAEVRRTWNALGRLTGSAPAEAGDVILLSAHLDHLGVRVAAGAAAGSDSIYNGADDDASGTVAVLELAEALATGRRPKRTVIFVWFGSEETGGMGASHFINAPPVPLDRILANLEFEMIGRPDKAVPAHTLWLTGYERSDLGPALAKQGAKIVPDPHPAQKFFMRSDNIQLARRGVIAQTISSFGLHADYHRPSDEVKTIDIAHMTDAVRSMVAPVLWLANSGFRPKWLPGMKP